MASAFLFATFGAFSAYQGALGHNSCGCFGDVRINPWLTCTLDLLLAVACLLIRAKTAQAKAASTRRLVIVLATWLLVGAPLVLFPPDRQMAPVSEDGVIAADASVVLLDPRPWPGKRFPLTKYIDVGPALEHGRWRLVFIRPGCPYCEEALRPLLTSSQSEARGDGTPWALIELPPLTANASSLALPPQANLTLGRLDGGKTWIANVPFTITVADGIVVEWVPGVPWRT